MDRYACAQCGREHDLDDIEPSYRAPATVLELSSADRDARVKLTKNHCSVAGTDDASRRFFLRVLLPFPLRFRLAPCCWGIWVELDRTSFVALMKVWDDPDQCRHGPWPAVLDNDAATYPSTRGLKGHLRFVDLRSLPHLTLDPSQDHPFVRDHRFGVTRERHREILLAVLHPS